MAANPAQDELYQFGTRVRFTLAREFFGKLIDSLQEQTVMIEKLVDSVIQLHKQRRLHVRVLSLFHRKPEA